ncbi:hypothetical protein OG522_37485 (plasmid) [Streptomyces sp. NBC_01431]
MFQVSLKAVDNWWAKWLAGGREALVAQPRGRRVGEHQVGGVAVRVVVPGGAGVSWWRCCRGRVCGGVRRSIRRCGGTARPDRTVDERLGVGRWGLVPRCPLSWRLPGLRAHPHESNPPKEGGGLGERMRRAEPWVSGTRAVTGCPRGLRALPARGWGATQSAESSKPCTRRDSAAVPRTTGPASGPTSVPPTRDNPIRDAISMVLSAW